MESNGRFYARPFNELHVGEIGKKPLSSERVAIEERLIFVRFQLQQKRPSGKGLHEAFLVRFRDRIYVLPKTMRLRSIVFTRSI